MVKSNSFSKEHKPTKDSFPDFSLQRQKYDINQQLLTELCDLVSRNILLAIVKKPKSVIDIATERKIPISSTYQKIKRLEELSLVLAENHFVDMDGKKTTLYRSRIREARIRLDKYAPKIELNPNTINQDVTG